MDEREIRRLFEVVDAEDWDELKGFFDPAVLFERPGYEPILGLDAVMRFYRTERVVASGRHFIDQVVSGPAAGAAWGRLECVLRDGSATVERFADTYLFAGGRIRQRCIYFFRPAI